MLYRRIVVINSHLYLKQIGTVLFPMKLVDEIKSDFRIYLNYSSTVDVGRWPCLEYRHIVIRVKRDKIKRDNNNVNNKSHKSSVK